MNSLADRKSRGRTAGTGVEQQCPIVTYEKIHERSLVRGARLRRCPAPNIYSGGV